MESITEYNNYDTEGKWKDNIYDCSKDIPTCLMGWWCGWLQIAQMYEKVFGPRNISRNIGCSFLLFYILLAVSSELYTKTQLPIYLLIYRSMVFFSNFYVFVLLVNIRKGIRKYYNIPETKCKGCEDVCYSFWCPMCSSCQNARQLYSDETGCNCTTTGDSLSEERIWLYEQQPVFV